MLKLSVAALTALMFAAPVAAQEKGPDKPAEKVKVLATFSILGDLVKNVGGDRVEVSTLVGPNADSHVYSPAPADARKVADANLVVANGLGFEGWIDRLVKSSGSKAPLVVASKGIKPLKAAGQHNHGHSHGHSHGAIDPHAWQAVPNVKVYVGNIRDALVAADPAGKSDYEANATAYLASLDALDKEVRETVARMPKDARRVITNHDAFGYFAAAYGLQFIGSHGVSTDAQPSAKDVARIIGQVRKDKIKAVFLENVSDGRLLKQIAHETGATIGGTLYSDALTGPDGPAPTYIDLIRHNIRTLSAALMG